MLLRGATVLFVSAAIAQVPVGPVDKDGMISQPMDSPMSGGEMMTFLGIEPAPPQPIANLDPAFREQVMKNCMDVLRDSNSGACDRGVALDLLNHLQVMQ